MIKKMFRIIAHLIFRVRTFNNKNVKNFAKQINNKKILELGSGGSYRCSVKRFFNKSNEFIQSDIIEEYGHKIIDITKMTYKNKFDIILCLNVLEHVYDFHKAINNIYNALKIGGIVVILVPGFYPLHDEPDDYWRFTEHSVRKLLKKFKRIKIKRSGLKQYPFAYCIEAVK